MTIAYCLSENNFHLGYVLPGTGVSKNVQFLYSTVQNHEKHSQMCHNFIKSNSQIEKRSRPVSKRS